MEENNTEIFDSLTSGTIVALWSIMVVAVIILLYRLYSKKEHLEITLSLWRVETKKTPSGGNPDCAVLRFLIGFLNKSNGSVIIKSYYLQLPASFAINKVGQTSFHLKDIESRPRSVPIDLQPQEFFKVRT